MTDAPALDVRNLTKRFGDVPAVDDLSFDVPTGSVTGFLGPNGAGKTTTMRVLLGLAAPTSGQARILGVPYRELRDPLRRVGAALEITGFHPGRTARDHLRVVAVEGGLAPDSVAAALDRVAMTDFADRRVGGYSSGMRQRLALAAALMGDPDVLVLDEPTNGLDPAGVAWLRGFLRHFVSAGRTVLISSHLLAEVAQTADALVVINRGRLLRAGSTQEITAGAGDSVLVRSPDAAALALALTEAGARVESEPGGALAVTGIPIEEVGAIAARSRAVLHELSRRTSTLEEAFLALTEGEP